MALAVKSVEAFRLEHDVAHARLPQIGRLHRLVGGDLLWRAFGQHLAFGQHHDAVGKMEDDAHVVLDQHDGELLLAVQFPDELGDVVGFLIAHAGGRFIEQQQPRLERERHHDFGGALVAMREFADQPVGLVGQVRPCPSAR